MSAADLLMGMLVRGANTEYDEPTATDKRTATALCPAASCPRRPSPRPVHTFVSVARWPLLHQNSSCSSVQGPCCSPDPLGSRYK